MSCTYLPLQLLLLLTAVRTQSQLLSGLNPSARLPRSSLPPLLALPSPFLPRPLGVRPEPVYTHSHPARAAEVFKTSMGSSRSAIRTHIHNHAAYLRLVETCIGMTLDLHECSIYITVSYSVLKLAVCSYIVIFAWKLLYICLNLSIHVLCMLLACAEFHLSFQKETVHLLSPTHGFSAPFHLMYIEVKLHVSLPVPIFLLFNMKQRIVNFWSCLAQCFLGVPWPTCS